MTIYLNKFKILLLFVFIVVICAFSGTAYAATAPTSNVSGELSTDNEGVDWYTVNWQFNFTINSGGIGDVVTITTNNVNFMAPKDVVIGTGETIGVLEHVAQSTQYPNSWNISNTYQIRLTKEVASASASLTGSTTTSFPRFISGDHYEPVWIAVNGVTAASGTVHMHSCSWGNSDTYSCIVSGLPWMVYENGAIQTASWPALVHAGDSGTRLSVGDTVVWHLNDTFFHLQLSGRHAIGEEVTVYPSATPGHVPHSVYVATEPYGFLEDTGIVPWKYKLLYVNEFEAAIQITQCGSEGLEWSISEDVNVIISPQNSSTVKFNEKRTAQCSYWSRVSRGDWTYYNNNDKYDVIITSQEVLSEASFFARVNTSVTNGSITPSVQTEQGATITISYSPNEGYELEYIKVDGANVSLSTYANSYTFTNTQGTHTVDVKYKIKTFTITTSVANGSITPTCIVNWSSNKTISYSPSSGYLLGTVTVDGSAVNIANYPDSYTFSNVRANHTIAVSYAAPSASKNWA